MKASIEHVIYVITRTDHRYCKAAPARADKMGVSSPIAIVAGASQRKPGEREIG